jgi:hypothetical protein
VFGFLKRQSPPEKREPARDWVTLKGGLEFPLVLERGTPRSWAPDPAKWEKQ